MSAGASGEPLRAGMGSGPVLEVQSLDVALPAGGERAAAVQSVSFTVGRGEIVCLVGGSGAGKSVIAQAIMGLLPRALAVTGGRIVLEGEDITHASAARLRELRGARMAMVFQEPLTALDPLMRCGAQIDEVLRRHTRLGAAQRRARLLAVLREVMLPEPERLAARYPHQLSAGECQRVVIAMALALDPALLIADEPTTALDLGAQAQVLDLIVGLQQRRGMAVLFATHDVGVAAQIAQRVVVLRAGELVETGPQADVLQRPQHEHTRALVAAVPTLRTQARTADPNAPPILQVKGLAKTYVDKTGFGTRREVHALVGVDFEIRRGHTLGLVGGSGAGKSTLARCLVRLIDPSAGSVRLGRDEIARLPASQLRPVRRRVQIVLQDPYRALNPRRTVGEAMIEGPLNYGMPRELAIDRAEDLLELVRIPASAMTRHPHQFSAGQRQRIAIARALMVEPELLVADEAVAALDVPAQAQLLELFEMIRQRLHVAMLFITHDLRIASQVCDTLAVLDQGRVVEYGPAERVLTEPQHACTRALLAAAPGRGFAFAR